MGRAATGKTTLKNELVKKWELTPEVSFTSRPSRYNEQNGIDYNFVTEDEFREKITMDEMLQYDMFNGHYYGTTKTGFENSDIMIATPEGVNKILSLYPRTFVIYMFTTVDAIIQRLHERGLDQNQRTQRIESDNAQFIQLEKDGLWNSKIDSSLPIEFAISHLSAYKHTFLI